jgi:hypothetical protein
MPLTHAETQELQGLRTCPLPMSGAQLRRYIILMHQAEADLHHAIARREQRRATLRTVGDVLFWLGAIPLWVLCALAGGWMMVMGTITVFGVFWMAFVPEPPYGQGKGGGVLPDWTETPERPQSND